MIEELEGIRDNAKIPQYETRGRALTSFGTMPTVDQFPSFAATVNYIMTGANKCIWYLPDKQRCCLVVNKTDTLTAQAKSITKGGLHTEMELQVLEIIAEQSCCARHHRNKMWGSDLGEKLAIRWQEELRQKLCVNRPEIVKSVKKESLEVAISSIPVGDGSVDTIFDAQIKPIDPQKPEIWSMCQAEPTTQFITLGKPVAFAKNKARYKLVAFAKHAVLEWETLSSKLRSPLDKQAGKSGSLYIYTHTGNAFGGMIKIGYTCNTIESRLAHWGQCGHGDPILLKSYHSVRHPERVELLTHFELAVHWYALRWCNFHRHPHIEWFKIDLQTASSVASLWARWMERANPYDRRGQLKQSWREIIDFLSQHEIVVTAEVMMQVQELEEGSPKLLQFLDDDMLRRQ